MHRINKKKNLRPSIFDRLIDDEPHLTIEPERSKHQQIQSLRTSVLRDLEGLLNTRYKMLSPHTQHTELQTSLLNYGMPDLATINIVNDDKQKEFIHDLENILRQYEPRFKSVSVMFVQNESSVDRTLRFRVNATLYADPAPEIIVFDSVLEPVSRSVNLEESKHG